jgi:hypothetical protein
MENKEAEFDKFVDEYNETIVNDLGVLGKYRDTVFIYKAQLLKHILKNEPKSILGVELDQIYHICIHILKIQNYMVLIFLPNQ